MMSVVRLLQPAAVRRRAAPLLAALWLVLISDFAVSGGGTHVFVLERLDRAGTSAQQLLQPTYVDGIALQILWREVEATPGNYDWRAVDAVVAVAQKLGKRVTLHVAPLHPPEWLFAAGAKDVRFQMPSRSPFAGRQVRDVVPWDPVFLERWAKLTSELGKRYDPNDTVMAVSIGAPSPEMVLPGGIPGTPAFEAWQRSYDRATYLRAWTRMLDTYQQALPNKVKLLAPGIVLFDEHFADEVVAYARTRFGDRLWLFNAGLRSDGVPQATIGRGHIAKLLADHANGGTLGLQTIWNASNDTGNRLRGSLRTALDKGLAMRARYFEVYAVDVSNSALQGDLADFRRRLGTATAP